MFLALKTSHRDDVVRVGRNRFYGGLGELHVHGVLKHGWGVPAPAGPVAWVVRVSVKVPNVQFSPGRVARTGPDGLRARRILPGERPSVVNEAVQNVGVNQTGFECALEDAGLVGVVLVLELPLADIERFASNAYPLVHRAPEHALRGALKVGPAFARQVALPLLTQRQDPLRLVERLDTIVDR